LPATRCGRGDQQQRRYARLLEACFQGIATNTVISRTFSQRYPQLRLTRYEHHYVFYLVPEGKKPRIIAVLHERMDFLARLADRLAT
jgi:plasmid stabilization system protein ParE